MRQNSRALGQLIPRRLGATLVGIAFVVPSFLMVLAWSVLYVELDGLPWMAGAFYGIGTAVIAIIARSSMKLVKRRRSVPRPASAADALIATLGSPGCSRTTTAYSRA